MRLQNTPGEPIVTRHRGAKFYCLRCFKEYRKCRCQDNESHTLEAMKGKNPLIFGDFLSAILFAAFIALLLWTIFEGGCSNPEVKREYDEQMRTDY